MKYLKLFETDAEYQTFKQTDEFIKPNVSHCVQENEVHYNPIPHDYSKDYLTFVALEDGTFVFFDNAVSYSLDNGETWTELAANTDSPTVTTGNKIMWKSELTTPFPGAFSSSGRFNVQGNIMSLLYGDEFEGQTDLTGKDSIFASLFQDCEGLISVENLILPATTLTNQCYYSMFDGCTSLTTAPSVLPATTLTNQCYCSMFFGCTSLTTAPSVLPATTLAQQCYQFMFEGCTSLTTAPVLPATTLAQQCYQFMFEGCTSLTTAPVLPATTLAIGCYGRMFTRCTSLTTAPVLPATILEDYCYGYMFSRCTSLTTAPELSATTLTTECYANMFEDCTSLTAAPELPATTLAEGCYSSMFIGCESLTNAAVIPNTVKPVGGEYCCGMYAQTNVQQSSDYDASAWSEEC